MTTALNGLPHTLLAVAALLSPKYVATEFKAFKFPAGLIAGTLLSYPKRSNPS